MTALPIVPTSVADLERVCGTVLDVLWRCSWQASVLAGMVLLVQFLLRKRLSARWRHALWGIVLLRLLIPVTPPSPWSLFNVAPRASEVIETNPQLPLGAIGVTHLEPLAASQQPSVATWKLALASLWLTGLAWMLAQIVWATLSLALSVRRMKHVDDPELLAMLSRCRRELGVQRDPLVLSAPTIGAPALMGFFKPRLLLPPAVTETFDAHELRHILLHELAHLKRHDVAINWLASLLQAVHWFNPMVWFSMARLRNDRELAADELVLSLRAGQAPPRDAYGSTLVKLLQTLSATGRRGTPALSGTVGILKRAHPMRRRITMIAQFHGKFARRWTIAAAACMIVLLGVGLTDAVRGGDSKPAGAPTTQKAIATTAPIPNDDVKREAKAALEVLLADAPITQRKLDLIKERMSQRLRTQRTILDSKGQPANQQQVEAQIAAINDELTRLAKQAMGAKAGENESSAAPASAAGEENVAARATLDKILPEIHVDAVGFSDVVDFLRDVTGANIYVNWRALEAAGIDRNAPVTMRLRDTRFSQVLGQLVRDVSGGESAKVDYALEDRVIVISTQQELASHPQLRSFDVSDLLKPEDRGSAGPLEQVVRAQVPGVTVTAYHDRLLVKGTANQIRGVDLILNALRENK